MSVFSNRRKLVLSSFIALSILVASVVIFFMTPIITMHDLEECHIDKAVFDI